MGNLGSRSDESNDDACYDTNKICFDAAGNLVYSKNVPVRDREKEIKMILEAEIESDKEEKSTAAVLEQIEKATEEQSRLAKRSQKKNPGASTGADGTVPGTGESTKGPDISSINQIQIPPPPPDKTWYIVDAAWIEAWLSHVHAAPNCPQPGPCDNTRLIVWDEDLQKWVGKSKLYMATKQTSGDYRKISEKTWKVYEKLYPRSGPAITVTLKVCLLANCF